MGLSAGRPGMIDVELVEDDTGSGPRATDPLAARLRRRPPGPAGARRRAPRLAAVVLLAGLVGAGALTVLQRHAAVVDVVLLPAAAPDLTVPPSVTWQVPDPGAGWTIADELLTTVTRADDAFVVTAVDLGDGRTRWATRIPADGSSGVVCPVLAEGATGPLLVCRVRGGVVLEGGGDDVVGTPSAQPGRLVVLDTHDGAVRAARALEHRLVAMAPVDGDLLTVTRADATTSVERTDLATGSVVWSVELALGEDRSGRLRALDVAYGRVLVSGPDHALLDAADGSLVGTWPADVAGRRGQAGGAVLVPHGFAVRRGAVPMTLWYDTRVPNGSTGALPEPRTLFGRSAEPRLSDGSDPDVVLTTTLDGQLHGWVPGREVPAWSATPGDASPLVRAGGLVVLAGRDGLRAVALRTGEERWRTDAPGLERAHAISDGRFVLVTGLVPGTGYAVSAVSLTDGSLLWRVAMPPRTTHVELHGGRLVATGSSTVVGLG